MRCQESKFGAISGFEVSLLEPNAVKAVPSFEAKRLRWGQV
jgi:hypothetical protein